MLINGINISSLGVKLYDRTITSNSIKTVNEWTDGSITPNYIRQQDTFKKISLSFLVLKNNEEEAFYTISRLTKMLKKAVIHFDDVDLNFDVVFDGVNKPSRLKNGNFIVSYELSSGYARGEREIYTTDASATSSFRLNVLYYKDGNSLVGQEAFTIRAALFDEPNPTLTSIGVNVDKYREQHYNSGEPTNLGRLELTYENLQTVGTLIINYSPIQYNVVVNYFLNSGSGYSTTLNETIQFTYPQLQTLSSIGQLIKVNTYRPEGYRATIEYEGTLTVDDILAASPIRVYYDVVENEQIKNITLIYRKENDAGEYDIIESSVVNVPETRIVDGTTLGDLFQFDAWRPNSLYYQEGMIDNHPRNELVNYADLEVSYYINYRKREHIIYVEYYAGTYPDWYRMTSIPVRVKYQESYDISFDVSLLGIDLDHYQTAEYQSGRLYNAGAYTTFDAVLQSGVLQVYYIPVDYTIKIRYKQDDSNVYVEEDKTINALTFLTNPILADIADINGKKPEGYQFDPEASYNGEITLTALTTASPIYIIYTEIQVARTKNILVRYKQELASTFSTINTSLIIVSEDDCIGGIRLRDIINLNAYKPEYYNNGLLNGVSENTLMYYDDLAANYEILYYASTYNTAIQYYTDDVDARNWVGADTISYRVIDFTTETTLADLGLNINKYKTVYSANGVVQYNGPINFTALRNLTSIDIVYDTVEEPEDPSGISYPHRFLFLQHNDLGSYEYEHPNWTMNHAYINSGVSCLDMSKLTVIMECARVDDYVPLHQVNEGYAYLFGSSSSLGEYYMRFNNQTMYGTGLSGVNTYEAKAGLYSDALVLTEENAIGWGANSGIYSTSNFNGYSTATFTFTNRLPTEHAQMPFPLYLFANNNAGVYADGLAGIGIYSCKILYDGELIRDFIPVQYYDLIGDQVAPSNCLYDKISQTFFEDATGQNSFNIRDDERYEDTDLSHKIGSFYVNYYQGELIFQTRQIFFRGNEFEDEYDLAGQIAMDTYRPAYYKAGVITNLTDIPTIDFEHLNNFVFNVVYEAQENVFQVNYYRDSVDSANLIATDTIAITERDFYQVPTFGDIVRLNKYKPQGYETNYVFPEPKTTLRRVMDHAPYDIVYTPIEGEEATYTTTLTYIKKVFGMRTYETVGSKTVLLGESDFRDGEYIDYYVDWDEYKPERFYKSGEPYQWYRMDSRLTSPSQLKNEYIIYYQPDIVPVEVRYYTDDIDVLNLIATTTWNIKIDSFDGPFYVVDQLPNNFINRFKPVRCDGGILQNSNVLYLFEELVETGIDILYETRIDPEIPALQSGRMDKVLYYTYADIPLTGQRKFITTYGNRESPLLSYSGGGIPYIDLGYTPKEIERLKVEIKMVSRSNDLLLERTSDYNGQTEDYAYIFGYNGATRPSQGEFQTIQNAVGEDDGLSTLTGQVYTQSAWLPQNSLNSSGAFCIRGHIPQASGITMYDQFAPGLVDGEQYAKTYRQMNQGETTIQVNTAPIQAVKNTVKGVFRKGKTETTDDDYNPVLLNREYSSYYQVNLKTRAATQNAQGDAVEGRPELPAFAQEAGWSKNNFYICDPITYTLDANKSYSMAYDFGTETVYSMALFNTKNDANPFEDRCKPRGSLTLFRTRNPDTGEMNINPIPHSAYPYIGGALSSLVGFSIQGREQFLNPYTETSLVKYVSVSTSTSQNVSNDNDWDPHSGDESANGIGQETRTTQKVVPKNAYVGASDYRVAAEPVPHMAMIWSLKIWDQDRLVRDLIPVAQGEEIAGQIMPENGLFDLITEIFFTNCNEGGTYNVNDKEVRYNPATNTIEYVYMPRTITINPQDICPLKTMDDPCYHGVIPVNYFDYDNSFIANQYVKVPVWFDPNEITFGNVLQYNDYKPNDFYLDGFVDTDDPDNPYDRQDLAGVYDQGTMNVYYKLRSFSKSVVYYNDNFRVGSKDIFFNFEDIFNASQITDLDIVADYYRDENFKTGRIIFNNSLLANNDIAGFINAPAPIVVYDKYTYLEHPELFYVEYYRGGAYDDGSTIRLDPENVNYFTCNLTAKVLNPTGAIKYQNHYHQAYYEDEPADYFLAYQARITNPYVGIHYGPARKYQALAYIVSLGTIITIDEERNGWGRMREYYHGWIPLSAIERIQGPGQNPDYDVSTLTDTIIPFGTTIAINRLTVDRLWAYVPAYQCWVKTEEISYNQSGQLYNAIGLDVINLDDIESSVWTNATSLEDIGIELQKKKLRYHNNATVNYDGTITYEDISLLHELEIVYPETIYNYNCHYHKNNINDERLGTVSFSCSISDWNPDWDYFIETSWQVDENGDEVLPTLYRAAPIALSWDYFGLGKNLFRPTGWSEGIYLWQPHPWDEEHMFFTFEELVKVGTQYVVYPFRDPYTYKLNYGRGYASRNNYPLILVPSNRNEIITEWSVEMESPMYNSVRENNKYMYREYGDDNGNTATATDKVIHSAIPAWIWTRNYDSSNKDQVKPTAIYKTNYPDAWTSLDWGTVGSLTGSQDELLENRINSGIENDQNDLQKSINWIQMRKENGLYGFWKLEPKGRYRFTASTINLHSSAFISLIPYHNEYEPFYTIKTYDTNTLTSTGNLSYAKRINQDILSFSSIQITRDTYHFRTALNVMGVFAGIYDGIKTYRQSMMTHYFVPVIQGEKYNWNDELHIITRDGFIDLLGDTFTLYTASSGEQAVRVFYGDYRSTVDEDPYQHSVDYFVNKPLDYITNTPQQCIPKKTTADLKTQTYPNTNAREIHTIPQGTVIVYDKSYVDTETGHYWYSIGDEWFDGTTLTDRVGGMGDDILAFDAPRNLAFIQGNNGDYPGRFYYSKDLTNTTLQQAYNIVNTVLRVIARWHKTDENMDYFLCSDDYRWYRADGSSYYQTEINTNYAVSATTNIYQYPIEKDIYKLGQYQPGDRILAIYQSDRNTDWLYTGEGWIYNTTENLLLVE